MAPWGHQTSKVQGDMLSRIYSIVHGGLQGKARNQANSLLDFEPYLDK